MHRFWDTIIEPLITAAAPQIIIEVGSASGKNTRNLLQYCARSGADLHAVDPKPGFDPEELSRNAGHALHIHRNLSLSVLPELEAADVVLLDGDHNWYTVHEELLTLQRVAKAAGKPFPLTILHDVDWPFGRRDMYYDVATVPAEHRRPTAKGGLWPGHSEHVPGGVRSEFETATIEGGPKNGIRTAIEDFLAGAGTGLDFADVAGYHGLGLIVDPGTLASNERLRQIWVDLSSSLLAAHARRVEEGRIAEWAKRHRARAKINDLRHQIDDYRRALRTLRSRPWRLYTPVRARALLRRATALRK